MNSLLLPFFSPSSLLPSPLLPPCPSPIRHSSIFPIHTHMCIARDVPCVLYLSMALLVRPMSVSTVGGESLYKCFL